MHHHKGIVDVNQVPTVVESWGRWIEESPKTDNEDIILCIPGNPGVTGYYRQFLGTLHNKLQCTIWVIGHAGHQHINATHINIPKLAGNENIYNLSGQTKHKEEFIKKYVPSNARVTIIGHSIGAYISLNLLKDPEFNKQVKKAYLMFPTIEDMAVTPNGKFLYNIIYYIVTIVLFLSWIFTLFPKRMQLILLYIYFYITSSKPNNKVILSTRDLIYPATLNKIFYMGFDEMDVVKSLDTTLIEPYMGKIKLYYGSTDNWAPVSYYKRLKERYPTIDAELCVRKFRHAFVLHSPDEVANMVAGWIENDK